MLAHTLKLHPSAASELLSIRDWYAIREPIAAERFVEEIEHAVRAIARSPLAAGPYLFGTRRIHLRVFPFSVVFRVELQNILIVAIAHQRRRPGYWKLRSA